MTIDKIRLSVACVAVAAMLAACGGAPAAKPTAGAASVATTTTSTSSTGPQHGGTLYFALSRDIVGLQPQIDHGATTDDFAANIYNPLVTFNQKGQVSGGLATSWTLTNPTTYVFHLRKGVKFSNGDNFTSTDVKYSLDRILNPKYGATHRPGLLVIKSITDEGPYTVQITLTHPDSAFPALLANPANAMLDKKWMMAGHDVAKQANGTGPFMLQSAEPGVKYVLVRNPYYWQKGKPYLDKIVYTVVKNDQARVDALLAGNENVGTYVPWQNIKQFKSDPHFKTYVGYGTFDLLRLNPQRKPLTDVRVRQALEYLTNRQRIISLAWGGYGIPITGGLSKTGEWWNCSSLNGYYGYDKAKGLALLKQAGLTPSNLNLTIDSITMTVHWNTAQVVMNEWKALGMHVQMQVQTTAALFQRRINGNYQVMQDGLSETYPDPSWLSGYFQSGSAGYAGGVHFGTSQLDHLFTLGVEQSSLAQRQQTYCSIQKQILQQAPWIYQLWRPQVDITSSNVHGIKLIPGLGALGSLQFAQNWWMSKS